MGITVEATYQNGVLMLATPVPLSENQKITVTIHATQSDARQPNGNRGFGLVPWTGPLEDLEYLINDVDNDPLERP